jgi:hypothetical protein
MAAAAFLHVERQEGPLRAQVVGAGRQRGTGEQQESGQRSRVRNEWIRHGGFFVSCGQGLSVISQASTSAFSAGAHSRPSTSLQLRRNHFST